MIFAGLTFHIQLLQAEYDRATLLRRTLEEHGAIYKANPEDPQCQIIIAFPPRDGPEVTFSTKGRTEQLDRSGWTYNNICMRFARRPSGDNDPSRHTRKTVLGAGWIDACLKEGKMIYERRWGLWEIMAINAAPKRPTVVKQEPSRSADYDTGLASATTDGSGPTRDTTRLTLEASTTTVISREREARSRRSLFAGWVQGNNAARNAAGRTIFYIAPAPRQQKWEDVVTRLGGTLSSVAEATLVVFRPNISPELWTLMSTLRPEQRAVTAEWLELCDSRGEVIDIGPFTLAKPKVTSVSAPPQPDSLDVKPDIAIDPRVASRLSHSSSTATMTDQTTGASSAAARHSALQQQQHHAEETVDPPDPTVGLDPDCHGTESETGTTPTLIGTDQGHSLGGNAAMNPPQGHQRNLEETSPHRIMRPRSPLVPKREVDEHNASVEQPHQKPSKQLRIAQQDSLPSSIAPIPSPITRAQADPAQGTRGQTVARSTEGKRRMRRKFLKKKLREWVESGHGPLAHMLRSLKLELYAKIPNLETVVHQRASSARLAGRLAARRNASATVGQTAQHRPAIEDTAPANDVAVADADNDNDAEDDATQVLTPPPDDDPHAEAADAHAPDGRNTTLMPTHDVKARYMTGEDWRCSRLQ